MLTSLPSYSNYLAPIDLDVTLSTPTHSSFNYDSSAVSVIEEDVISNSAPSTPKRSGTHNLRREGYSEEKCRYVLVKYCSGIPRNFNYAEGVQLVYEKLREHCGDENLDLSIGVLYEFIEVETQFTFEQGAAFRRWQFDHSQRAGDLTNNHAPRMGNIIVGNIIPTERLRQWRHENPERQRGMRLSDSASSPASSPSIATVIPHFGITYRSVWHIENTMYVSGKREGTRVHYCPTAQEMHDRIWDESYGRGGKLIGQRVVGPNTLSPMVHDKPDGGKISKRKKTIDILLQAWTGSFAFIVKFRLPQECFEAPSSLRSKCGNILRRHRSLTKTEHEELKEILNLPDPDSEEGKVYYRNIKTANLPDGVAIPNAMFARKHDLMLYNEANEAQVPGRINRMISVEDLALQRCLEANYETTTYGKRWSYRGPMTASLFKDSGVDYQWDVSEASGSGSRRRYGYELEIAANSYYSLDSERSGDLAALRIPAAPARRQRAISHASRALQGGKNTIHHDSVKSAVDKNWKDATRPTRPYAKWSRSGTEAHLFSGQPVPEVEVKPLSHFNRFAAQFQNRFNPSKSRALKAEGVERPVDRPEGGIRKRTAESVRARKDLLKKIVTFDGAQDEIDVVNEKMEDRDIAVKEKREDPDVVVKEKAEDLDIVVKEKVEDLDAAVKEKVEGPLPVVVHTKNNNNNNNNSINAKNSLANRYHILLTTSILRSSFLRKLSVTLDYSFSALAGKVAEHRMSSPRIGTSDDIQVDGVFILGSPQPLTIRKLHQEYVTHSQENSQRSNSNQNTSTQTPQEQHPAQQYPPRTSSHLKGESPDAHQRQHRRANTDYTAAPFAASSNIHVSDNGSFMGDFTDLGASIDRPQTSSNTREKVTMQEAAGRFRNVGPNPYEFRDSAHDDRMTTMNDFLANKFGNKDAAAPSRLITERPLLPRGDSGPSSERKATSHVKNFSSDGHPNYHKVRKPVIRAPNDSYHSQRAEFQQVLDPQYGLMRSRSSPHIGGPSNSDPRGKVDSSATYKAYDRDSDPEFHSESTHVLDSGDPTVTPPRGRQTRARGLGIEAIQLENAFDTQELDQVPAPKRSKSPLKRLFGPGGFLGNSGAPNSPADPRYVLQKNKNKPGILAKIKENFAEIPRSLSPVKHAFKSEEMTMTTVKTKFPVSLSPTRQANLYMVLELLICRTANNFLIDQHKQSRMTTESLKKIQEFWKSKGRPQVIGFSYDQATQRDLIVHNQKTFRFHGPRAHDPLQVNGMLYSWKVNAREMAIRTFCTPDAVIQKQLHDTYRVLELLGASPSDVLILQAIHRDFNRYKEKALNARERENTIKELHGVERKVVLPDSPIGPMSSSASLGLVPIFGSRDKPSVRHEDPQTPIRERSGLIRAQNVIPFYASESPEHNDVPYPRHGSPKYTVPQTVSKDRPYDPYSTQTDLLDDYYSSGHGIPNKSLASRLRDPNRSRAATESRGQRDHHDSSTSHSSRNHRGRQESTTSYSSHGSGSRNHTDHHDSATTYSSHANNSGVHLDHHGSATSYATQISNARALLAHHDSATSFTSRAGESRNMNNYRDNNSGRRGDNSPVHRAERSREYARDHRAAEDDLDDLDDFSAFGKYGAGL